MKLANDTSYGLGAGLHSSEHVMQSISQNCFPLLIGRIADDANQCMRVSSALEAGTVSAERESRILWGLTSERRCGLTNTIC